MLLLCNHIVEFEPKNPLTQFKEAFATFHDSFSDLSRLCSENTSIVARIKSQKFGMLWLDPIILR